MFMGPLEQVKPWSMKGVEGVYRFLARVWRLFMEEDQEGKWQLSNKVKDVEPTKKQLRILHETIKKVGEDIESLDFNTAISQMMKLTNEFTAAENRPVSSLATFLHLLNPFAPHISEEINRVIVSTFPSIIPDAQLAKTTWPEFNEDYLVDDEVEIVVQVNGKLRDKMLVAKEASNEELEATAKGLEKIQPFIDGVTVRKVIIVPGKLINIVAN